MSKVVSLAPVSGDAAARERTSPVAEPEGLDVGRAEQPGGAAQVKDLAGPGQDCGDEIGVAGEFAHGVGGEQVAVGR